jgi:hypothetical protein
MTSDQINNTPNCDLNTNSSDSSKLAVTDLNKVNQSNHVELNSSKLDCDDTIEKDNTHKHHQNEFEFSFPNERLETNPESTRIKNNNKNNRQFQVCVCVKHIIKFFI